ncbi:MAG: hypothetical protein KIT43_10915 [Bauldia sp.]|nr:hypothetical protein [Bauldia sp.]
MAFRLRGSAFGLIAALALVWSAPAGAFEILTMLLQAMPEALEDDPVAPEFDFAVPRAQAGWPVGSWQTVGLDDLNPALLDRDRGIETVGIAFSDLDGILRYGAPPDSRLYLYGSAVAETEVRTALMARPGMSEAEHDSFAAFSVGTDFAVDPGGREHGYPFGGGWRAHRVAVRDGFAAVTYSTPALVSAMIAIQRLDAGTVSESPVVAMVDAAANLVPAELNAYAAMGLPGEALRQQGAMPGPGYVIVAASASADWEAAQFMLLYDSDEAAAAGVTALHAALAALREWPEGAKVQAASIRLPDGAAAIVTVLFAPGTSGHPSSTLLNQWRFAVISRSLDLATAGAP